MNEKRMILQIINKRDMMMEEIDIGYIFIAIILCLLKKKHLHSFAKMLYLFEKQEII